MVLRTLTYIEKWYSTFSPSSKLRRKRENTVRVLSHGKHSKLKRPPQTMAEQFIHIYYKEEWNSENFAFYRRLMTVKPSHAFELGEHFICTRFGCRRKRKKKKRGRFLWKFKHMHAYIVMCTVFIHYKQGQEILVCGGEKITRNTRIFIVNNSLYSIGNDGRFHSIKCMCVRARVNRLP